jgi:signal transduction histidine kinase
LRRRLPLLPLAPLLVVVIGIATAATIALLGVAELRRTSDAEASSHAASVAQSMAARLRFTSLEDRAELVSNAAAGATTELLLVGQDGQVVVSASLEDFSRERVVEMLIAGRGVTETMSGRHSFATQPLGPPLEHLSVVALVTAPESPPETLALIQAVAALALLLVGVAAAVSFTYARAAHDEVEYVRRRIEAMADPESDPAGKLVPIRALDEVGVLASSFNTLAGRFIAAEKTYRADLADAARVDQERLEFLAGLSHELRTPLNAILGFSHVLETEVDGPLSGDARESVEIIRTSGEHLRTLIDDILDLSALETGQIKLSRRPLELRKAAEEVVREANAIARHKGLQLGVTGDEHVFAYADKRRMRQILTNLVANAVKFTNEGAVTVDVRERDHQAVIRVVDTGPGIPAADRDAIFEAYRQSNDARLRQGGAGLGLATVKRLVVLHGGDIRVESKIGEGSSFTLTFPLATDDDVEEALEGRGSLPSVPPGFRARAETKVS